MCKNDIWTRHKDYKKIISCVAVEEMAEYFYHSALLYQIIITYLDTDVYLLDMAQGKLKAKVQLPKGAKQKGGNQKKRQGPRKGGTLCNF